MLSHGVRFLVPLFRRILLTSDIDVKGEMVLKKKRGMQAESEGEFSVVCGVKQHRLVSGCRRRKIS